jgi:Animal haem peroxidase.
MDDVDLIVGGILENPEFGVVLGPTFTCLLALQFISIRNGDRFWYENDIPPSSFTRGNYLSIFCNPDSFLTGIMH